MATATRAGRNDLCPCGSGRKFKKCCEAKQASSRGNKLLLALVAAAVLGGAAMAALSFTAAPSGPLPGQVWSAEHGHYH